MTETSRSSQAASAKALVRLVRQVLQAQKGSSMEEERGLRDRAMSSLYPQALVAHAVSLGLLQRNGEDLSPTPEARIFLKRALLPDETGFGDQHRDLAQDHVEVDGDRLPVRRNLAESPLAGLARLKNRDGEPFFPIEAVEAGERLLGEFTRAQLQPRVTSSWEPRLASRGKGGAGGMADIVTAAAEARRRLAEAMNAMGPELSGVALDVCCFGKGLELVERERQWPARSAKLMLRTALLALARHYAPPVATERRRSHRWASEDFRPPQEAFGSSASR